MSEFEVHAAVAKLKSQTSTIRKKRFYQSRLDPYKGELFQLHNAGATTAELQRWLRTKRITVAWSTVSRWITQNG